MNPRFSPISPSPAAHFKAVHFRAAHFRAAHFRAATVRERCVHHTGPCGSDFGCLAPCGRPRLRDNGVPSHGHRSLTVAALKCATLIAAACLTGCAANHSAKPAAQSVRVERDEPPQKTPQQRRDAFGQAYSEGLLRAGRGEFAEALGAFEAALQLNPDSTDALIGVGACHESIGDPVAAIRFYRRALAINPIEPDAYANLGTAYIKLYHRERNATWRRMAVSAWRQSLALRPDQPDLKGFLSRERTESSE